MAEPVTSWRVPNSDGIPKDFTPDEMRRILTIVGVRISDLKLHGLDRPGDSALLEKIRSLS